MPKLPDKVTVDLRTNQVFIDGVEFPWFITEDGVDIMDLGSRNSLAHIIIPILSETVEVIPADPDPTS
jgi:hypothetical protein